MTGAVYQPGRRELADRLKSLREDAEISGNQLAGRLSWVQSKVSKIETGKQLPTEDDIRRWVGLVGGGDQLPELLSMLERARLEYATWREHFRAAGGASGKQAEIRALEAQASQIREFRPTFISGLLQTAPYAKEFLSSASGPLAFGGNQDEIDRMVAIRMQRQQILYAPGKKIRLVLLEAALRTRVCARGTLIGQLDRLNGLIGLPALELGIVPFEVQLPIMPFGDFTIYNQDLVVVEGLMGEQHVSAPDEIELCSRFFELISSVASYGEDAAAVIRRALDALRMAENSPEPAVSAKPPMRDAEA